MNDNKIHYVDNKKFTKAMTKWVEEYKISKSKKEPKPQITPYIASCFKKIATRYAKRPNFCGYAYKEDMISNAVLHCIKYAHNFDISKSNNAFSYFTQYCHNAFLQMIKKENSFAEFKFNVLKESNSTLGKQDFRDIDLYDEDNAGLEE